jgi:polyisoprenoid-binding protein YceI
LTVPVFAGGLLSAFGQNPTIAARDVAGEARFVPATLGHSFVRVTVRPDCFQVADDVSEKDKREIENTVNQEVLEVARYPEIIFASLDASAARTGDDRYAVELTGNLTLHGVTRAHTMLCQVALTGDLLRASGEFPLRQTDYGIKLVSVAGGTLKVKDELKCSFDIVARRQA